MYPRPWWKIVDWRIVLAVAVPAWLLVGGVLAMTLSKRDKTSVSDKTESFPVSKPVQPPEIIPAPRPVEEVAAAPSQVQIDPAFVTALSDSFRKFLVSVPQQPAVAALPPQAKLIPEGCQAHGTAVHFVKSPVEAFQEAANREKLVFILHLSGNIEDDGFTWNNAEALRVNALAKKKVGEYLNAHFVSSHQKVGTFEKIGNQKVGGNVASYFCRPDGTVIHAIAGPVDQATFLAEARFAVELHHAASFQAFAVKTLDSPREQAIYAAAVKKGFADRLGPAILKQKRPVLNGTLQERVNTLLYHSPLPPLEVLYTNVWENVLNEKLSAVPISVR